MKPYTETNNPDLSHTAMLGVLDSIQSLLDEKEEDAIEAKRSAKAEQRPIAEDSPQDGNNANVPTVKKAQSGAIPLLDDVVSSGTIELVKVVQPQPAAHRQMVESDQTETGEQKQPEPTNGSDNEAGAAEPIYFSDKLQEEVEKLVNVVMDEYSEKILDRLREKLRQRVAYLLIQSKEEKLRR